MTAFRRPPILRPEVAARAEAYVGRSIPRVEDQRLLTGTGRYGDDFDCEGQLYAHVVRSPVSHGVLRGVDTSAAKQRPGVVAVITAADVPDVSVPVRLFPTKNAVRALQAPLARDRVRYVGDPVAVVVAESPYVAEDAGEDVQVDLEQLDPVLGRAGRRGRRRHAAHARDRHQRDRRGRDRPRRRPRRASSPTPTSS